MTKRPVMYVLGAVAALAFLLPAISQADDAPAALAELWMVTPKVGQGTELRKGLAAHMAMRSENGDPRQWEVYTPLLGEDLNRYAVRTCCFNWADQDSYETWQAESTEVAEHFRENVMPHVEQWAHYFEAIDWANSHWVQSDKPYRFYAVTEFNIKPGEGQDFTEARTKMSQIALNHGWDTDDHPWLWASTIGGKAQESIIIPHHNYASFDRTEDSFLNYLSKHMGAEAAADLLEDFAESAWSTDFQIWEFQEELSMSSGD